MLQDGSALPYREPNAAALTEVGLVFESAAGNNKYYAAALSLAGLASGSTVKYYLAIAYDDYETAYARPGSDGVTSVVVATPVDAESAPISFTTDELAQRGAWSRVLDLPTVAIHRHVLTTGNVWMWGRRYCSDQSLDVSPVGPLTPGGPLPPPATNTPSVWDPPRRSPRPAG